MFDIEKFMVSSDSAVCDRLKSLGATFLLKDTFGASYFANCTAIYLSLSDDERKKITITNDIHC